MEKNLANLGNCDELVELLKLASKEQDQDTMGALFEEILRHLEDKQRRLAAPLLGPNRKTQQRPSLI